MIRLSLIYLAFLGLAAGVIFMRPGDEAEAPAPTHIVVEAPSPEHSATTNAVLAALEVEPRVAEPAAVAVAEVPAEPEPVDEMRELTTGILASLGAAPPAPEPPRNEIGLKGLIAEARSDFGSDAADPAASGTEPPRSIIGSSPRDDRGTLIVSLVQRTSADAEAQVETPAPLVAQPETPVTGAKRVKAPVYYVVKPGDNLATISIRFYGNKDGFKRIYEANKDQIADPEIIKVGQRLRIPDAG